MNNDYSAPEAARVLGISLATLYSYVSRGLLTPTSQATSRSKRYPREDVLRLAARKADAKRGGHMAVGAMSWGVPVLETRISHIADGHLYYRGHDAVALAGHATLETTACILWDDGQRDYFSGDAPTLPPGWLEQARALTQGMAPLERAMALLPMLAKDAADDFKARPALMRLLAAILLDTSPSARPIHEQVGLAWGADAEQAQLIRAALVLLADHELNASTFTVRCVASTGASLAVVLSAGLAALSGAKHGGGSRSLRALFDEAPLEFVPASQEGYGHPLYPDGDPRAACLLERLRSSPSLTQKGGAILELNAAACKLHGAAPHADLALAALEIACGWPQSAGMILFALARAAGWIAHAAEQVESGAMIRPRARYVGRYPS
ncbi:MAG: citrate synthase family protein [Pseudomonadota bacterium]